ncbi:hypothetical protein KIPB_013029 [Kipferlia bialata]|uniref:Uncharacterized protein n=1 Tax=Kipferlia bialata TaxID=797122 RepID=A0A391NRX8_9EUKA|nr:hypothetical protein KIPB_013029 [Kipferlia bialata]|eukprot:g13029.t1
MIWKVRHILNEGDEPTNAAIVIVQPTMDMSTAADRIQQKAKALPKGLAGYEVCEVVGPALTVKRVLEVNAETLASLGITSTTNILVRPAAAVEEPEESEESEYSESQSESVHSESEVWFIIYCI